MSSSVPNTHFNCSTSSSAAAAIDSMDFFSNVDSFDMFDTAHDLVGNSNCALDATALYNNAENLFLTPATDAVVGQSPFCTQAPLLPQPQLQQQFQAPQPIFTKVLLKCASEKENCYTSEFSQYLFKKPHKYDLKMMGNIDPKELILQLHYSGEDKPFQEDVSKVCPSELCIVNEQEFILRFCLLVCSRTMGGKTFQLVVSAHGRELFRSSSFKCLARKRARHVKNGHVKESTTTKKATTKKAGTKRKATEPASTNQQQQSATVGSPLGSVSSPPSTPVAYPPLKKPKMEHFPTAPQITWDLFQFICGLDTSKIAQNGGNSRVNLAINVLSGLSEEERNTVLRTFMQ